MRDSNSYPFDESSDNHPRHYNKSLDCSFEKVVYFSDMCERCPVQDLPNDHSFDVAFTIKKNKK